MKTILSTVLLALFGINMVSAQDRTTVTATNSEISDNLDLRAVASIFGDSRNLEDFENRLNNPETPISNLDLNEDNQVDYLRVIETVEGRTHLIVVQSVLGRDQFQDVATIEVEKDRNNRVQVQVVGNVFMYGPNYIYEPVYSYTPVIYNTFWVSGYRPYCSTWYWGYYPSYYIAWRPFPIFRYRHHINLCINVQHHYNYVSVRRSQVAYGIYNGRRCNAYEVRYPNRAFTSRHTSISNRHELDQTRVIRTPSQRGELASYNGGRLNALSGRSENGRKIDQISTPRDNRSLVRENVRTNERSNIQNTMRNEMESPRVNSWKSENYSSERSNGKVRTILNNSESGSRKNVSDPVTTAPTRSSVGRPRENVSVERPKAEFSRNTIERVGGDRSRNESVRSRPQTDNRNFENKSSSRSIERDNKANIREGNRRS